MMGLFLMRVAGFVGISFLGDKMEGSWLQLPETIQKSKRGELLDSIGEPKQSKILSVILAIYFHRHLKEVFRAILVPCDIRIHTFPGVQSHRSKTPIVIITPIDDHHRSEVRQDRFKGTNARGGFL